MDKVLSCMSRAAAWHVTRHPPIKHTTLYKAEDIVFKVNLFDRIITIALKQYRWERERVQRHDLLFLEYSPEGLTYLQNSKEEVLDILNRKTIKLKTELYNTTKEFALIEKMHELHSSWCKETDQKTNDQMEEESPPEELSRPSNIDNPYQQYR